MKQYHAVDIFTPRANHHLYWLDHRINESPYFVKKVEGLEPVDPGIILSDSIQEKVSLLAQKPAKREIILTLGIRPDYRNSLTIGDLRRSLYEFLDVRSTRTSMSLSLLDETGRGIVRCRVFVKRFETDIFSKDPQVVLTLSATSPFLEASQETVLSPDHSIVNVEYEGDAATGYQLDIRYVGTDTTNYANFINVFENGPDSRRLIMEGSDIIRPRDLIRFNTLLGSRNMSILRGTNEINMLPYLSKYSTWIELYPGLNNVRTSSSVYQIQTIRYTALYWGA